MIFELQFRKGEESIWVCVRSYDTAALINAMTGKKAAWKLEQIRAKADDN